MREAGAVPATIGVLDGAVRVGLAADELERFDAGRAQVRAARPRRRGRAGAVGATTVGGTLAVCRAAGIRFMGTGGIGGVHRDPRDVSPDLQELARTQAVVVSSGAKSLLDVPATVELLETLGVPVLGYRTDELPLFYTRAADHRCRRESSRRTKRRQSPARTGTSAARRPPRAAAAETASTTSSR